MALLEVPMVCNTRRLLDADVMSAKHHLEMRLKSV